MTFPGFPPTGTLPRPATPAEQAMARKAVAGRPEATRESYYREALETIVRMNVSFAAAARPAKQRKHAA